MTYGFNLTHHMTVETNENVANSLISFGLFGNIYFRKILNEYEMWDRIYTYIS